MIGSCDPPVACCAALTLTSRGRVSGLTGRTSQRGVGSAAVTNRPQNPNGQTQNRRVPHLSPLCGLRTVQSSSSPKGEAGTQAPWAQSLRPAGLLWPEQEKRALGGVGQFGGAAHEISFVAAFLFIQKRCAPCPLTCCWLKQWHGPTEPKRDKLSCVWGAENRTEVFSALPPQHLLEPGVLPVEGAQGLQRGGQAPPRAMTCFPAAGP